MEVAVSEEMFGQPERLVAYERLATAEVTATEERDWLKARLLPLLGIDSGQSESREESFDAVAEGK